MSDITIQNALRDIILATNIPPSTTLGAQNTVGATTIQVANNSHFAIGGMVTFTDSLGEETLPVLSKSASGVSPQTVTLNFAGLSYSGLQYAHTLNTKVYTNLLTEAPIEIAPMLDMGDPCIFIMALDERVKLVSMGRDGSTFTFRIQYHRKIHRPAQAQMNFNVYAKRQQVAARTDLETIAHAIRTNRHLNATAVDLGERGSTGPFLRKSWQKLILQDGTEQMVATLDVVVQDLWSQIS